MKMCFSRYQGTKTVKLIIKYPLVSLCLSGIFNPG